ncbi:unnamed protein product [Gordionus sp. m RMFG-2023]
MFQSNENIYYLPRFPINEIYGDSHVQYNHLHPQHFINNPYYENIYHSDINKNEIYNIPKEHLQSCNYINHDSNFMDLINSNIQPIKEYNDILPNSTSYINTNTNIYNIHNTNNDFSSLISKKKSKNLIVIQDPNSGKEISLDDLVIDGRGNDQQSQTTTPINKSIEFINKRVIDSSKSSNHFCPNEPDDPDNIKEFDKQIINNIHVRQNVESNISLKSYPPHDDMVMPCIEAAKQKNLQDSTRMIKVFDITDESSKLKNQMIPIKSAYLKKTDMFLPSKLHLLDCILVDSPAEEDNHLSKYVDLNELRDSCKMWNLHKTSETKNDTTGSCAHVLLEDSLNECVKNFTLALNTITYSNFDQISERVAKIFSSLQFYVSTIDYQEKIQDSILSIVQRMTEALFIKAINEREYAEIYAKLCQKMLDRTKSKDKHNRSPHTLSQKVVMELLSKVQHYFENEFTNYLPTEYQHKKLGNLHFICQLYQHSLLSDSIIRSTLNKVLHAFITSYSSLSPTHPQNVPLSPEKALTYLNILISGIGDKFCIKEGNENFLMLNICEQIKKMVSDDTKPSHIIDEDLRDKTRDWLRKISDLKNNGWKLDHSNENEAIHLETIPYDAASSKFVIPDLIVNNTIDTVKNWLEQTLNTSLDKDRIYRMDLSRNLCSFYGGPKFLEGF